MARFGIHGEVIVGFTLHGTGKVSRVHARESTSPAFEEAAIRAVRQWRYETGLADSSTQMAVPIAFSFQGGEGSDLFFIDVQKDQSKLLPELRYDTAPKVKRAVLPVYPYELRRKNIRGAARAAFVIDPQGRVAAIRVLSADQPEFGLALAAALEGFVFTPALKDGIPVPHAAVIEQKFTTADLPDNARDTMLDLESRRPERIVSAATLDSQLDPISPRAPIFPRFLPEDLRSGQAVIECIVDQEGFVRLPRIVSTSHPAFGYAAVQAVTRWVFEVPTVGGKPTATRIRLPFNFQAATIPSATARP